MGQNSGIHGQQRAKVVNVTDPAGLLRVSVRLVGVWDNIADSNLPWAERVLSDSGAYTPLLPGDYVWVDFPYGGDSTRPRVTGRATDSPGGVPNLPAEASGQGEAYTQKTVEGAPEAGAITASKDYVYDRNGLQEIRNASGSWSVHAQGQLVQRWNERKWANIYPFSVRCFRTLRRGHHYQS
ncbi:hypothetical protein [Pantoea sp. CCBC3-3-1]|uniref:hypothetical protein n=1 Tax=Pantoea sp. CCBC3-3-1 TaxID=2490851 RepID=UPI0011BE6556|nr:hypothetical protein [Pantoea sp. CCBC3-3-1]